MTEVELAAKATCLHWWFWEAIFVAVLNMVAMVVVAGLIRIEMHDFEQHRRALGPTYLMPKSQTLRTVALALLFCVLVVMACTMVWRVVAIWWSPDAFFLYKSLPR